MCDSTSTGNRNLFLFWILCNLPLMVHAQQEDLAFETLPLDQGAATHVSCILQDRTGFIWIGTWSGLYRYDGYSFVAYKHNSDDSTSIADNLLSTIYEDKAGTLWVGSWLGLEELDQATGTFHHFTPNPQVPGTDPSNNVSTICEDKTGRLWVGSWGGLYCFDRISKKFTPAHHDSSDPGSIAHNSVGAIYESKDGSLWFGTVAGLDKYDFATGKFQHCLRNQEGWKAISFNIISAYWITSILEDEDRVIWLGTQGGLVAYNPRDGSSATYRYTSEGAETWLNPRNTITALCRDPLSGSLWIVTEHGLFSFERRQLRFLKQLGGVVTSLCVERSGTLLLGTDKGLQKRNLAPLPFKKYPMGDIASGPVVHGGGIVWVLSYKTGWHKFDTKERRFVPYSFGSNRLYYVFSPEEGGGSVLLKPDGGTSIRDSLDNEIGGLSSSTRELNNTFSAARLTRQGFYSGSNNGRLYLLYPKSGRARELLDLKTSISWIREDRPGFLWVSTMTGRLVRYDQEKGTYNEYLADPRNPSSWCGKPINWAHSDSKGRLWFATSGGLEKVDRQANGFVHVTEKDGLPSNNVRGVAEDDHGFLWVSTTKGISRFDPETGRFKHYDASYGLEPAADVFMGGVVKTTNGEMLFGGATGVTMFHPDSIRDNRFIPPVVITSFRKFDRPAPLPKAVHLPYDENFISFEFAALSYISPERNQYAYMMEGIDRDWVNSGTRRYASYPNLPPGNYIFRVKGSNNEGVWNETGTSLAIVISPPWWRSPWAYGFYVLAILSALYATWKMQMRRVRVRHELEMNKFETAKLHEVDELKSRFFANISHEFRTPLTLILGPVKRMRDAEEDPQKRNDLGLVHNSATRLLELVNQLLDLSRLESGSMKLQAAPENVVPLLKGLLQSFCSYAERKRITMAFTSSEGSISVYIDRDKFQKIITNILGNAFKFTPEGGRVELSIAQDSQFVNIRISDTGIGIPVGKIPRIFDRFYQVDGSHTREQEGTGIGLSLTKELVELHKGTIAVESEVGRGSAFIVRLPLGRAHLLAEEIRDSGVGETTHEVKDVALPAAVSAPEKARPDAAAMIPLEGQGRPVLLIVEDNADVRQYIRRDLEGEYSILEAVDGADGWNRSLEHLPDIIISDIMMPKMDGFMLCDRLKTDERTSHIPVILLTAKAASQDKIKGFQTGADDYIMKPFEQAELRARLRNLLEQRKRLHEHFRKHGLFEIEVQKITPVDQKFLQNALSIITERMAEPGFGVETLAERMAVSHSLLLKKVEALTGEPPVDLIKRTRLNKAAKLIEGGFGNAFQVALEVGFSSPSYFTKCFRKQFGVNPSDYRPSAVRPQA
jgi:signal transduction histidine kinase/ligand-binding sensor domain-containing protein/CheY-like chemotaxis protein